MSLYIKQQGKGKPLVLLHGWGFNGDIWDDIAAELAQEWHLYQVDLPGHGRSPMCDYTLPSLTKELATYLPSKAIWMGWSLGGLLAMAMARYYPVRALVLVSTSPRFIITDNWPHAITPAVLKKFSQQLQGDTSGTLQRFLALQVSNRSQLRYLKMFLKKTCAPQVSALAGGLQLLQNTDLRSELPHILCPALLCLGGCDTLVPIGVEKDCQQCWPNLQTVCIKPAAHIPFLSHPDIFMPLIKRFINSVP